MYTEIKEFFQGVLDTPENKQYMLLVAACHRNDDGELETQAIMSDALEHVLQHEVYEGMLGTVELLVEECGEQVADSDDNSLFALAFHCDAPYQIAVKLPDNYTPSKEIKKQLDLVVPLLVQNMGDGLDRYTLSMDSDIHLEEKEATITYKNNEVVSVKGISKGMYEKVKNAKVLEDAETVFPPMSEAFSEIALLFQTDGFLVWDIKYMPLAKRKTV